MKTSLLEEELSRASSNFELLLHPVITFMIITISIKAVG
jgi:hypothetical protein